MASQLDNRGSKLVGEVYEGRDMCLVGFGFALAAGQSSDNLAS